VKVLVFGETGQVARELKARAGDIAVESLGRDVANFEEPAVCSQFARTTDADAIIIAAAWTAVDDAEDHEDRARVVNAITPGEIAKVAAERGVPLIYISTDYVFDGMGAEPFSPDNKMDPLGAYGRTKAEGERLVKTAGGVHGILRTSWVVSSHGSNFVKTMLRLGGERDGLRVVADQVGGPTCASDIAEACLSMAVQLLENPEKSGVYHFSGGPDVSWADFARAIFEQADLTCNVEDIPSSGFPTRAERPLNSRMDNQRTFEVFGLRRPDWRTGLSEIISDVRKERT
jgi:dTDP-4-dehydrorhamnose reductase